MNDGERDGGRETGRKGKKKRGEMKSEAAVTGKGRGWKTGDSGREWTARAISGGRLTTSQLKEDTRAFFSVLDDVFRACIILNPDITGENFLSREHVYI